MTMTRVIKFRRASTDDFDEENTFFLLLSTTPGVDLPVGRVRGQDQGAGHVCVAAGDRQHLRH